MNVNGGGINNISAFPDNINPSIFRLLEQINRIKSCTDTGNNQTNQNNQNNQTINPMQFNNSAFPQSLNPNFFLNSLNSQPQQLFPYLYGNQPMPMNNFASFPSINPINSINSINNNFSQNESPLTQINNNKLLETLLLLKNQQQPQQNTFLNNLNNFNNQNPLMPSLSNFSFAGNKNLPLNFENEFMHKRPREDQQDSQREGQISNQNFYSDKINLKDMVIKLQHNNSNINVNLNNNNFQSSTQQNQTLVKENTQEKGDVSRNEEFNHY